MTTPTTAHRWCRKELAHVALHQPGRDAGPDDGSAAVPGGRSPHRGIREVEADSVAYMLLRAHNVTVDTSTVPYVSGWASSVPGKAPVEVVQDTAARVRTAAVTILDKLDTAKVSDSTPPGLDRSTRLGRSTPRSAAPDRAAPTLAGHGLARLELDGHHHTGPASAAPSQGGGR